MKIMMLSILSSLLTVGMLSANHHKGPMMGGKMLEKMDTDKDGKISKQEWQLHHEAMFSKMDADQDGFLTKDEMKAHHKQMMKKHGKGEDSEQGEHHPKGKKTKKKPAKEEDEEKPE
jgi:hypothetical protein